MSKNEVRTDSIEPRGQNDLAATTVYTETTSLGGPKFRLGPAPAPCSLTLSHEVLAAARLGANYTVELVARPGEIVIKALAAPKPSAWETPRQPNPGIIDELMAVTREREARLKMAREGGWIDVGGEESEEPLSDEQIDQEAL